MRQRSEEINQKRRAAEEKAHIISDKHAAGRLTASNLREAIWARRAASFRLDVAIFKRIVWPMYVRRTHARRRQPELRRTTKSGSNAVWSSP